ncbi:MAG: hypothetical protein AAF495_14700 [Pseudomonadota bacterium]
MRPAIVFAGAASQASSYLIGGAVILMAFAVMMTGSSVQEISHWATDVLGLTFATLLAALVFLSLLCWVKVSDRAEDPQRERWLVAGIQAANGIATLALTYTLLGISLGIGVLAEQELTPETVQGVIRELTGNFSLAFMTSVIGLPTSALLRAILVIAGRRPQVPTRNQETPEANEVQP